MVVTLNVNLIMGEIDTWKHADSRQALPQEVDLNDQHDQLMTVDD